MSLFDALYRIYDALTDPTRAGVMLAAMAKIWLMWLVYGAIFIGIGASVRRVYGLRLHRVLDWIIAFWVGWAMSLGILQLWHLFLPINVSAFALLAAAGLCGLGFNAPDMWHVSRRIVWQHGLYLLVLGVVAFLFANAALGVPSVADFALYHQQAILWNNEYAIVPGLGNLHGRLAFNNAFFLYAALTNTAPFADIGNHVSASLLIFMMMPLVLYGVQRVRKGDSSLSTYFAVMGLPIIAWIVTQREYIRTPDSDLSTWCLGFVLGFLLLTLFEQPSKRDSMAYTIFAMVAIGAAGTISKLSFAAIAAVVFALGVWLYWQQFRRGGWLKLMAWGGIVGAIMVITWSGRGVILSGYPAFPATFGAFDVDWRVACDAAQLEADYIYSWARTPNKEPSEVLGNWRWLRPWAIRTLRQDVVFTPLLVTLVGLGFLVGRRQKPQQSWLFLLVPLAALLFWFMTAPDPRFAGAIFWILANGIVALVLADIAREKPSVAAASVLLLALLLAYDPHQNFVTFDSGFQDAPAIAYTAFETDSGLVLHVPRLNDGGDERCYDTPLPCTPYANPGLSLREAGEMRSGFMVSEPLLCGR